MDEKKMGFFTKVKNSLTSPKSYAEFLKDSMGKAVLYLLLLCIIFGGIAAIKDLITKETYINTLSSDIKNNVPAFTFKNGELNVDGIMPIVLDEDKDYPVIIDTSENADVSLLDDYSTGILITKTKFIQKLATDSTQETPLSSFKSITLSNSNLTSMLNVAKYLILLVLIIEPLLFFAAKFIAVFIISIIGLLLNSIFHSELSFGEIYKLSIYAITLSLILKVLCNFLPISTGFFSIFTIVYFGLGITYLTSALKSIGKNKQLI
ncbi:MAG: DUF1189 domain-containing protein [Clostridiaceae bacterium]|nr:DUF1189 domain-containing protein [Clostridiaceae bacterium]